MMRSFIFNRYSRNSSNRVLVMWVSFLKPSYNIDYPLAMNRRPFFPYLVLFCGVLIASTASIMIKAAQDQGVPSLAIAAGRLGLASLLLTPVAWARTGPEIRSASRRDLALGAVAGVFLALHFA